MLKIESRGSFQKTERFLKKMSKGEIFRVLERYGREGVAALRSHTPSESGQTANSWSYEVKNDNRQASITWSNSHMAGSTPVVVLIQYGHGTGTGGYVPGRDFINPALQPIFDKIANDVWKEVVNG